MHINVRIYLCCEHTWHGYLNRIWRFNIWSYDWIIWMYIYYACEWYIYYLVKHTPLMLSLGSFARRGWASWLEKQGVDTPQVIVVPCVTIYIYIYFGMRRDGYVSSHCRFGAMTASRDVVCVSLPRDGCRLVPPWWPQYCYVSRALGR